MQITSELVSKLAWLSRLEFTTDGFAAIQKDLQQMIDFMDRLHALDTTGVEPLTHMADGINITRPDIATNQPLATETAMSLAAYTKAPFFAVPKVIQRNEEIS